MKSFLLIIPTCYLISIIVNGQDIAFPESHGQNIADEKLHQGRVPLYAPNKCPENQLLYPGDQKNDWICDCGPAYIYYPQKDKCYYAFKQGPCEDGNHLILKPSKKIPECVTNPCEDGYARYKGRCYEMGKPNGPCRPFIEGGGIFDVNATTLVVECLIGTDPLSLFNVPKNCPPGSKRDSSNRCKEDYNV